MHLDNWKSPLCRMAPLLKTARGCSRRTLWRCGRRRFALLALLIATLSTILCRASLNYRSLQSFATNPMIWSRRWRRWWGPSAGTPWRRPARASGPGSMLSSQLTAVLLNMWLSICISANFFYFNKIGWFSAVLFHLKERRTKFRIYRCHPV